MSQNDLNQPFKYHQEQIDFYKKDQYIKLKNVMVTDTLAYYKEAIENEVGRLSQNVLPLAQRDTYKKAFLQVTNLWRHNEKARLR